MASKLYITIDGDGMTAELYMGYRDKQAWVEKGSRLLFERAPDAGSKWEPAKEEGTGPRLNKLAEALRRQFKGAPRGTIEGEAFHWADNWQI